MMELLRPLAGLLVLLAVLPASAQEAPQVPAHVGSGICAGCHRAEARDWTGSHHDLAWELPDEATVLGDFDDATFEHGGETTRFFRRDGRFMVEALDGAGETRAFEVLGVAGIAPLQQYLVATEPGRLQPLDVAWDVEKGRWFHLYPDDTPPPGDGLHWSGPYKTWNSRCAECHATGFEKNFDAKSRRYTSAQAEIGVGCESCHGPGAAHVAWVRTRATPAEGLTPEGFTVAFAADDPQEEIQLCAQCHARRGGLGDGTPVPGTPFADAYKISTLRDGLYHPDGTILDEVYVYGSFLQSKMHAQGVRCTDCHDPHKAGRADGFHEEGNAVCARCHGPEGNPRFPTLRKAAYDDPAHHFHAPGTEAARCVSCHMVERTYMQVDPRRDHSFRVPRPDLTVKTGAPNACNDCHEDRSAEWAAAALEERFPGSAHRGPHFAETFALARDGVDMTDTLSGLAEHEGLPGIVRATALELIAPRANPAVAERLEPLLADPDPTVRAAAILVQQGAEPTARAQRLVVMLDDPVRLVRVEAARNMLGLPIARLPDKLQADRDRAMAEYRDSLRLNADFPETQMAIGGVALTTRDYDAAAQAFAEAVRLDPQLVSGWSILARLRAALGDREGAVQALRDGLAANPGDPALTGLAAGLEQ